MPTTFYICNVDTINLFVVITFVMMTTKIFYNLIAKQKDKAKKKQK